MNLLGGMFLLLSYIVNNLVAYDDGSQIKELKKSFSSDIFIPSIIEPYISETQPSHIYEAIIRHYNTSIDQGLCFGISSGYFYFSPIIRNEGLMRGVRDKMTLRDLINNKGNQDIYKKVTGLYKIHLMPKHSDIAVIIMRLLDGLVRDSEFQEVIESFKVLTDLSRCKDKYGLVVPIIVIYIANGKESAQKALDKTLQLFTEVEGLDITPRYNQKITSLIYFSQGDSDYKNVKAERYFELPDKIYYNPMITGVYQDYHLRYQ